MVFRPECNPPGLQNPKYVTLYVRKVRRSLVLLFFIESNEFRFQKNNKNTLQFTGLLFEAIHALS